MSKTHRLYEGCVAALLMTVATGCATVDPSDIRPGDEAAAAVTEDVEAEFAAELGLDAGSSDGVPREDVRSTPEEERKKQGQAVESDLSESEATQLGTDPGPDLEAAPDPDATTPPESESALEDPAFDPMDEANESAEAAFDQGENDALPDDDLPPALTEDEEAAMARLGADEGETEWYEVDPEGLATGDNEAAPVAADAVDVEEDNSASSRSFREETYSMRDEQLAVLDDMITSPLGNLDDDLGTRSMLALEEVETDYDFVNDAFEERESVEVLVAEVVKDVGIQAATAAPTHGPRVITSPGAVGRSLAAASVESVVRLKTSAAVSRPKNLGIPKVTARVVTSPVSSPVASLAVSPKAAVAEVSTKDATKTAEERGAQLALSTLHLKTTSQPQSPDEEQSQPHVAYSALLPRRIALVVVRV